MRHLVCLEESHKSLALREKQKNGCVVGFHIISRKGQIKYDCLKKPSINGTHCHKVSLTPVAECSLAKEGIHSCYCIEWKPAGGGQKPASLSLGDVREGRTLWISFLYLREATVRVLLMHLALPESTDLPSIAGATFAFVHFVSFT